MAKENVLFLTNKIFIDENQPMGGVRLCTYDYIRLLQASYNVVFFPVTFNRKLWFRIKSRLGVDSYEEYDTISYMPQLKQVLESSNIGKVFINLSNASDFARAIKTTLGPQVKTILCSHGNESGDFLHQSVRFAHKLSRIQRLTAPYRLGKVMQKELDYRINHIDLVLTVSQIEEAIEKWVGVKDVFMVPRVLEDEFVDWQPTGNRAGFIGDISHYPNYYGVLRLCEELEAQGANVELRVVGKDNANMRELKSKFSFITHLGYLDDKEVVQEVATWKYFLNLVFYYSKGVSTKLAQGLNWGLPVISTTPGNRGYDFGRRRIPTFDKPDVMARELKERMNNIEQNVADRDNVLDVVRESVTYNDIMKQLSVVLENI